MKNLLLNTFIVAITLFAFTNCEKDPLNNTKAQWGNSEGRWSDANLDCSGNQSRCLPVVVIHGIAAPNNEIVDGLGNTSTGVVAHDFVAEYFAKEEVIQLFTNLNEYQLGLLQSGEYGIKTFYFDRNLYQQKKVGRVKFFAAKKEVTENPESKLGDYEFAFEVDIRE
jgi:hypothetical protein